MAAHKYAGSNSLASNAFYALAAGVPYWIMDSQIGMQVAPNFPVPERSEKRAEENMRLTRMFETLPSAITPEQTEIANAYLGAERFKSPEGLLADLEIAERRARYGT